MLCSVIICPEKDCCVKSQDLKAVSVGGKKRLVILEDPFINLITRVTPWDKVTVIVGEESRPAERPPTQAVE